MDRYTQAVLTVIAVCLLWLTLGGAPPVEAQGGPRVYLAGWVDADGEVHLLGPESTIRPAFARDNRYVDPLPVSK